MAVRLPFILNYTYTSIGRIVLQSQNALLFLKRPLSLVAPIRTLKYVAGYQPKLQRNCMLSKYLPRYVGCAGLAELGLCCPPLLFSAAAPVSAERALLLPLIQLQVSIVSTVSTLSK